MKVPNCPTSTSASDYIEISDLEKLPAQPLVSVVMLAYRHEKYLAEAIEGVLLQETDFPIELVIAEDCSPDSTMEVAKRYQREHPELIRIVTSARNVGMIVNFARAIAECRGRYIAICEGDDYWHRADKLRMQVDVFASNPDIVLVHTAWNHRITWRGYDRICRPRQRRLNGRVHIQEDALGRLVKWELMAMTCTAMIRADVAREFAPNVRLHDFKVGDWPLFAWAAAFGEVAYLALSTATYRKTPGSAMNSGGAADIARVRNAELIHREMERALGVARYPNWPRERSLAGHLYVNAIAAHDLVALRDARSELERAGVKVSPWRYWIDELKARRPFVYRVSRLWPDSIQAVRHLIRYRPV